MLSQLRRRLTYANVVSSLCLFIVLGGTSYAVATGSIDSRELKNNSVRGKDVRNRSLSARDLKPGTTTPAKGRYDAAPVNVGGDWVTVLDSSRRNGTRGGLQVVNGAVEATGASKGVVKFELRIVHNDHVHSVPSGETLSPGATESSPVSITCNGFRGRNEVQLQARSLGGPTVVTERSLTLLYPPEAQ